MRKFVEEYPQRYFLLEVWRFATVTLYAISYWIYLQKIGEEKLRRATEKQLLKTEIDFLKAQINPHFVFNTLNFVYNDVAQVSPQSGEAIMSLTRLMRYSVESTKSELATVGKEIEAIEEYLHLQKIRFGDTLAVSYSKFVTLSFFSLPPLVLLSIIENAFKYGILDDEEHPIEIDLKANKNGLWFRCKNKKRLDFIDKATTAVGQSNIQRRLEIVYSDQFTLKNTENELFYEVQLEIDWIKK